LAAYRAKHGEYPASLERLVPEHIGALPTDIFGDGPYRYRRTDDGCVLYSAGLNGVDDRGLNADYEPGADIPPEADDIPLHVPPKLPPP